MPSSAPSIRGFQLDSSAVGDVRSNVNLFRGDVNLSQPLFTMPGRSSDQALDVSVNLLYQSNVTMQAQSWNRSQPTGTLGLGWTLPLDYIQLQSGITAEGRSYQLMSGGGGGEALIPEVAPPLLFSLDASAANGLSSGAVVPAGLVTGFASFGTVLSSSAIATLQEDGSWLLSDAAQQRLFRLQVADQVQVEEGGESFQLQSYNFYRIVYYACYERWTITDDSGLVKSYGGLAQSAASNCIAWSVVWTTDGKNPTWKGTSSQTTGQLRSARAWYLESVHDLWGDQVSYAYNGWAPVNGFIPVVEQPVGEGGLAYTKAVYLTSITDVFGRKALFTYADKLWNSADDRAREYSDPHKETPDNSPNAWQDCYETRYLSDISVVDTDQTELFGVSFTYDPNPNGADPAVVTLTDAGGRLAGDSAKRLLTSMQARSADGTTRPSTQFSYYTDPKVDGYAPGALASLTTPGGATARYTYLGQDLDVCQRALQVNAPDDTTNSTVDTPTIWYGSDFAVLCWVDSYASKISLQVYTWQGRWMAATPTALTLTTDSFVAGSLQVLCGADAFAISY